MRACRDPLREWDYPHIGEEIARLNMDHAQVIGPTRIVNDSVSDPPWPSVTFSETRLRPACAAVGVQVIRPVEALMAIPAGALSSEKVSVSWSASLALASN